MAWKVLGVWCVSGGTRHINVGPGGLYHVIFSVSTWDVFIPLLSDL